MSRRRTRDTAIYFEECAPDEIENKYAPKTVTQRQKPMRFCEFVCMSIVHLSKFGFVLLIFWHINLYINQNRIYYKPNKSVVKNEV